MPINSTITGSPNWIVTELLITRFNKKRLSKEADLIWIMDHGPGSTEDSEQESTYKDVIQFLYNSPCDKICE